MDTLEKVSSIEGIESQVEERFEVFVRAYVLEFEKKIEAYAKEAEVGGPAKSGKIADTLVIPIAGALGASAGAAAGVVAIAATGAVVLERAGASIGKSIGGKAIETGLKCFSGRNHRKKAKKITQIFQNVKPDELRKMFVEAASLIYYSFQSQFDRVTDADCNWQRALSKLAIDACNRSISYLYNEETTASETLSKDFLTKSLILGESKGGYLSHVTSKTMQQVIPGTKPGHTVIYEGKDWKTSDIYEKVGIKIVGNNGTTKYYKKEKCGNDYGHRWAFNWENDSSWMSNYTEEDCGNILEESWTSFKLEELEAKMDHILININKEDPKLQLERIEDGVDTVKALQKDIGPMKHDLGEIKTKLLSGLPKSDEPKIFNVTPSVKSFTGRTRELILLHDKLQTQEKQVVVSQCASISGLGGMGKSEMARKYAWEKYGNPYEHCIWIDSETESSIKQSFHWVAKKLKIPITEKSSDCEKPVERNILHIVEDIYKRFSNSKSLFIFDNVNEYEEIKDFLPSSLSPTDEKPTIIITSRNSDWDIGDEGDVGLILLDQFTPEEALGFVKKVLGIKVEDTSHDSSISELTNELCRFPLALRQATSYIKAKKFSNTAIENYLVEFRKKKRDLLNYRTNRDRYTETTYTTWQITFKNIEKNEENGPLAIRLVEIMAYLVADDIPLKGFIGLNQSNHKLNEAVDILRKYSIITVKEEYNDERYFFYVNDANIHRLVQQVLRLWLQEEQREEEVLRTALIQIHDNVPEHHQAALWSFACNYTTLIDNYFCKICEETKSYNKLVFALKYLVGDGDTRTIQKIFDYFEDKSDLWREISYHIVNMCLIDCNYNDDSVENTANETHIKAVVLYHAEVFNAIKHSNSRDLELFLQSFDKSLINSLFERRTALERSAHSGKLNVVKILVENGVNVNSQSWFHRTALHIALIENHLKVVEYLLDHGADSMLTDIEGRTTLDSACYHGHLNIVQRLVDTIAICENGTEDYWRPLHLAAQTDQVEIVEFLTNHEVYRSAMKDHGQSVCSIAAESGSIQVVKYLIDNKLANVNGRDCSNCRIFTAAAESNRLEIVKYLLTDETHDKVDINVHSVLGITPLFQAVQRSKVKIARFLIEHGEAVDNVQNGNTLLGKLNISAVHFAVAYKRLKMVKLLIEECKANVNMGLNTTFSPFQVAKFFGNKEISELLIRNGADTTEWCEDKLENITRITRRFCQENNSDVKYMFVECTNILDDITKHYEWRSDRKSRLKNLETLRSFLKQLLRTGTTV